VCVSSWALLPCGISWSCLWLAEKDSSFLFYFVMGRQIASLRSSFGVALFLTWPNKCTAPGRLCARCTILVIEIKLACFQSVRLPRSSLSMRLCYFRDRNCDLFIYSIFSALRTDIVKR
jgi:hypothetical protein